MNKLWWIFPLLLLVACKGLNDQPAKQTLTVDVTQLQRQMQVGGALVPGVNIDPEVKALMIGPLVLNEGAIPWSLDQIQSDDIYQIFGQAMVNSQNYFTIYDLPLNQSVITIELPPVNSKRFQVLAVGLRKRPASVSQVGKGGNAGAGIYFGLSEKSYAVKELANGSIAIQMKRVCLVRPTPAGCASFGNSLTDTPRVAASVEIVGFRLDGADYTTYAAPLPVLVSNTTEAAQAVTWLTAVRDEIVARGLKPATLSVLTTHRTSVLETEACKALAGQTDPYNTLHRSLCTLTEFTVRY